MAAGISVHRASAFLDNDLPLATGTAPRSWGDGRITADNRFIEVTMRWRGRVTDVKRVNDGLLTVGNDGGSDLVAPVVGRSFDVVKRLPGGAWSVRFREGMAGTVTWRGEALPLSRAGELGACVDGDAMALPLTDDVTVCLVVGEHTLEVRAVPKSRVVPVAAFFDSLWANAATLTMFAAAALIATTVLFPVGMDDLDDELLTNPTRFQTMILKPPPRDNAFLARLTTPASKPPAAAKPEGTTGAMKAKPTPGKGRVATVAPDAPSDEAVVQGTMATLFGDSGTSGMTSVFNGDIVGEALNAALGTIDGNRVAGRGSAGLGLRGGAPGGGGAPTGTLGTNRNSARGRSSRPHHQHQPGAHPPDGLPRRRHHPPRRPRARGSGSLLLRNPAGDEPGSDRQGGHAMGHQRRGAGHPVEQCRQPDRQRRPRRLSVDPHQHLGVPQAKGWRRRRRQLPVRLQAGGLGLSGPISPAGPSPTTGDGRWK